MRTPSQTVGPFFGIALPWPGGPCAVAADAPGAIRVEGRLTDGRGDPVPDGLVETWQLGSENGSGIGPAAGRGFARAATDADGRFAIVTLKPGPLRDARGVAHAPYLAVSVFARGLLARVVTRVYFADEIEANAADPVLGAIDDPAARATLIAARTDGGYRFDIRLQGPGETVFFDV